MRYFLILGGIVALLVMLAADLSIRSSLGQEGVPAKPGASNLESATKRAVGKAEARKRKTKLKYVGAMPADEREFACFVLVVQLEDSTLCLFQGGSETEHDQFVVFPKDQIPLLEDAFNRLPKK
jgi:hypothetical protein